MATGSHLFPVPGMMAVLIPIRRMDGEYKRVSLNISHWKALKIWLSVTRLLCRRELIGFIPREQREAVWPWVSHL